MSSDRDPSIFELAQLFAQNAMDALIGAMKARGYVDVCMPDVKLLWTAAGSTHSVQELAKKLGITKQYCAREVSKLNDAGFLTVTPDPGDARALRVALSTAGQRFLEVLAEERLRVEARFADEVGAKRMAALSGTLLRLTRHK